MGEALIDAMCQAQEHRGPDVRGMHLDGPVGLGIQRLRVIDLAGGDQPIYNEDRSVVVVLNGEIYNYRELRADLRRRGHRFATDGDTEVIVHLYEERGPECVAALFGMFAFALWDGPRRRLVLARDRLGKKPLHYARRDEALSFASELPALMADAEIPGEIDLQAIDQYLTYGYVPAPHCVFGAVRTLAPAHVLVHEPRGMTITRYWRLDYSHPNTTASRAELEEEVRRRIRAAVKRRMVSDVPIGAFLSGGIDSAVVVAAMAEESSHPVQTFSIGFDDRRFDERSGARLIAERFATDHHELVVAPDAVAMLPRIARHYGQPLADHSALPTFYLAEFAARHVTVALNGDGGDECFAGYHRYNLALALAQADRVPAPARRALSALAGRLPTPASSRSRAGTLRRLAVAAGLDPLDRHLAEMSIFTASERAALYTPEFAAAVSPPPPEGTIADEWARGGAPGLLGRCLEVDVNTYLPGDLLVKMDIATMAYSLEARAPLLDHELMEFAATVPDALKAGIRARKQILRSAVGDWVPQATLQAPKRGFELPVTRWMRTELHDYARSVLLDPAAIAGDWARPGAVETLLREHAGGTRDHGRALWALLMLELWNRESPRRPERSLRPAATAGGG